MIKTLSQQPKGLWILCGVEIWERFSYYGMRALLILYLTSEFWGMSDTQAYLTYGSYVAFVYMTPLIGGYISDTFLGHTTSVKYGCIFIMIGHILLSTQQSFFWGLAFVVVGTGFFKSSMATNIGRTYGNSNNHLRDSGYTLFYMAVNLGSGLALIAVPLIAKYFSWHAGFATAAFGMGLGLLVLFIGEVRKIIPKDQILVSKRTHIITIISALIAVCIFQYLIFHAKNTANALYIMTIIVFIYLIYKAIKGGKEYTIPILAVLKVSIIVMFFWILFEQTATSVLLFTERFVNLNIFGFTISAANTHVFNSLFIIILAPFFAIIWGKWNISIFRKMGTGLIITGLAMGAFAISANLAIKGFSPSLLWIVLGYMLITMGELCCSPTGLAAISKVAPADIVAFLFGVWGIKSSLSNYFASYIATFTDVGDIKDTSSIVQAKAYYHLFFNLTITAIIIGLIILLISKQLKRFYKI